MVRIHKLFPHAEPPGKPIPTLDTLVEKVEHLWLRRQTAIDDIDTLEAVAQAERFAGAYGDLIRAIESGDTAKAVLEVVRLTGPTPKGY